MKLIKLLACLVGAFASDEKDGMFTPAETGKFFYMDMKTGTKGSHHMVDVMVGGNHSIQSLFLTLEENKLALVSTSCPNGKCNMPNKFNLKTSNTLVNLDGSTR